MTVDRGYSVGELLGDGLEFSVVVFGFFADFFGAFGGLAVEWVSGVLHFQESFEVHFSDF